MDHTALTALSPLDGRYSARVSALRPIMSEYGLIYFRLMVEIKWLIALTEHTELHLVAPLKPAEQEFLLLILENFDDNQAALVKKLEKTTNHDVKAVEYYLQQKISKHKSLKKMIPLIHFGCTSEDINNLAYSLMLNKACQQALLPTMQKVDNSLRTLAKDYLEQPMLARTHGQPASPTTLGKEFVNFAERLQQPLQALQHFQFSGKFNGAVGNFNAHCVGFPDTDWVKISRDFVESLGLTYNGYTTQIEPHDNLAEFLHTLQRYNNVMIALNRDMWGYIALGRFNQRSVDKEVGSSTMPHKINPIDFENSEGNLGLANALADHMANKLPISRWQRDLTDSTVLRNLGVVLGYCVIAYEASIKGLSKLIPNKANLSSELNLHWEVLGEAVQTVMRRHGIADAYEQLKAFTRGKAVTKKLLHEFIDNIKIPATEKVRLKKLTPANYIGLAVSLAKEKI